MKPRILSRTTRLLVGTISMLALAAPAYAMAPKSNADKNAKSEKELPKHLRNFKTPFKKAKNKKVIRRAAKTYGPGKRPLPRFKQETSGKERASAIVAIDRTMLDMKKDKKTPGSIRDGIRVWEAMSPAQRNEMLAETEAVVVAWPAGVAATAAAVTAGVALAEFTYKVYKDYRDGGDDDGGEAEPSDAEGGDAEGGGGDGSCPSCHEVRGALGY